MKKICLCVVIAMLFVMVFAGCDYSNANEPTWEQYQDWLINTFADKFSDPDSFAASVESLNSWADINVNSSPWSEIFGTNYYGASTWEEFSALGVGSYTDYASGGAMTAAAVTTGGASGGSGEMGGTTPGSATGTTTAAGGTTAAAGGTAPAGGASGQPGAAA